ncbi:hypothetical protein [Salinibacter altiplanensis]|uniref:hypothetical protein n=1 Tax=Salinibacter altiplanensis TaxID=1803181 RepID=UPI000C9FC0FA|nr:hypothetical protein [Salinibacter altiplanensis]
MSLPLRPLTTAIYERLTGEDGAGLELPVDVFYAGSKEATTEYVAIQIPTSSRRVTKTTDGRTSIIALRCHTEAPDGNAEPLTAFDLAESAHESLESQELSLGLDHALLYFPEPQDVRPNGYDMDGGTRAMDVILRYDLHTQHTP